MFRLCSWKYNNNINNINDGDNNKNSNNNNNNNNTNNVLFNLVYLRPSPPLNQIWKLYTKSLQLYKAMQNW